MFWSSTSLSLDTARAFNAAFAPSYTPVGIFVGGTSGIGQGIAEAFARHTKGNSHIVLVGRNRAAAEAIIARFPKPSVPGIKHEFVECDSKLVKNVKKTAAELLTRFPRINFLVLSAGAVSTKPYDESEEGIDRRLAVLYYSRWKFIYDLMPGLRAAKAAGEDAKVISILKAGSGGPIDPDNFGLKKNFSFGTFKNEIPAYHDAMIEVSKLGFLAFHRKFTLRLLEFCRTRTGDDVPPLISRHCYNGPLERSRLCHHQILRMALSGVALSVLHSSRNLRRVSIVRAA
jgi:NAD(P)-dependent dehydrogenase (short-subunit alcohol dehydrogenase family)